MFGLFRFVWNVFLWIGGLCLLFGLFIIIGFKTGLLYDPNETQFQRDKAAGITVPSITVEQANQEQNEAMMKNRAERITAEQKARYDAETMQDREPVKR